MSTTTDRELLVREIRAAWPHTEYPPDVDAALRSDTPHPEERAARDLFRGKRWDQIPAPTLLALYPNPFLIGSIPFNFYLPAFLLTALSNSESDLDDFLVSFALKPPKQVSKLAEFRRRFSSLNQEKRSAVADFLTFLAENEYSSDARTVRRIQDAIDRFWGA